MTTHILQYQYITPNGSILHQKETFTTMLSARINLLICRLHKNRRMAFIKTIQE